MGTVFLDWDMTLYASRNNGSNVGVKSSKKKKRELGGEN